MKARFLSFTDLIPAGGGRLLLGRAKQLRCEVEQARIRIEILGGGTQPHREETALLGEDVGCEPTCRLDVRSPVGDPALTREELHHIAYLLRREAGLIHIAQPPGEAFCVQALNAEGGK